jgi:RNA polymerase sigma-70 factor (ECF subfamily)
LRRPESPGRAAAPLVIDGQREAGLFEQVAPYVHRLVRRVLGSDSRAQDLVQDVLLRVLHHRYQLRDDRQLRPWVRAITFNVIYSELRERRQRRALSQDIEADLTANLEHSVVARDLLSRLHAMLDRLPSGERTAFVQRYVERRTVAEIAALGGYSVATAQRRLRRPRRILRSFLAQHPTVWRGSLAPAGGAGSAQTLA